MGDGQAKPSQFKPIQAARDADPLGHPPVTGYCGRMLNFFRRSPDTPAVEALHAALVDAARRPGLYAHLTVPDTPWGRIESVMLHVLLVVRRLSGADTQVTAHALVEHMFAEFDRGLRQVGVGDLSVPKKMQGLGGDWLARIEVYGPPLDARDETALAEALARNVLGEPESPEKARALSRHILACEQVLRATEPADIAAGRIGWPAIIDER